MKCWLAGCMFLPFVLFMSCGAKMDSGQEEINQAIESIKQKDIESLATKRVFFGHMSVGYNIIEGIEDIRTNHGRFGKLVVQEIMQSGEVKGPGIYHGKIGRNGFPKEKCDTFKKLLIDNGLGSKLDVAFFKFCYVDFGSDSNVPEIFKYYAETIERIRAEFPGLTIIHVTAPLTVHSQGIRGFLRNLVKGDLENLKRNEFNMLLINRFKATDPIYDLAKVESTSPDHTRTFFKHKGATFYALAKGYTKDGGHLNRLGRYEAGKELLALLTNLAGKQ